MRVLTIVGARPQFVKAAAVSRALAAAPDIEEIMVHTGQHFDPEMSVVFFDELAIPAPRYNLHIHGGGHGAMTGRMLEAIEEVMVAERPDWVLVYGDTNSTIAGAVAAAKLHVRVAHVEAGLRSYNRRMPEEINRVVTDHVSELLFCPTAAAIANLKKEGITQGVHHTGDVMFDATLHAMRQAKSRSMIREKLGLADGAYAVATIHRAENTDDPEQLRKVLAWLSAQAKERRVVFPLHPRTRLAVERTGLSLEGLTILPPVGYLDMASLLAGAAAVFTDSGGLQKEAYFHGKPCITLRTETEWVETVECGWNRLWTTPDYAPRQPIGEYGKGQAGEEIARLLSGVPGVAQISSP
ncbi:MAG: non-hydrolyzing UDP-N-acetylglucosamine 2-epimerase [Hyphomicrobiales bacterium]